jgi:hypothetical protein
MAAAIRLQLFGGIIPRISDRGLPDNAAQFALNAKLTSGELRAWNRLLEKATLPIADAVTVFHYTHLGADRYLAFNNRTHVVKAPLINETLGRLYWTNNAGPQVNTTTRIEAAQAAFKLGVPPPGGTFTVVPTGGTVATAQTRVYLAALESSFGEIGGPTTPVTASGNSDGTWTINGLNALTIDALYTANITHLRLYRTITSATGVDYRLVNRWTIAGRPAAYVDNITDPVLASNELYESLNADLPPDALRGLVAVAGGFMAGYSGRTVRMSIPYFPHAWPEDYSFAVEDDIVGLGTFGNTVVVCTKGRPYLLVGPSPDGMFLQKMEGVQPCLSERSIVSTSAGVMFATTDGLVLVDGSTNRGGIVSRNWVTKDEWMAQFSPATQMASVYQDRYFAFYSNQLGFAVGFDDPITGYTELQTTNVQSVDLDPLTGQTLVTIGSKVYEWDSDTTGVLTYVWRSKPFLQVKPLNFGVIQVRGTFVGDSADIPVPPATGISGFSLNKAAINGDFTAANIGGSINGPPAWQALSLDPAPPAVGPTVLVRIYVDDILQWTGQVGNEDPVRLPSGFKGTKWEIELQGGIPLYSVTLADTAKSLESLP